ncbi:MAG: thymidylate kinase [Oscillibacter sp.]|nr:thymidylate kinase [Oscillibacter sp.]
MNGKLIVFEGTDGSGKATQSRLLCARLEREGVPFRKIDFPRYGKPSAAMVEAYLRGDFGKNVSDVNAYAASLFFALDRYDSFREDWGGFYRSGGLVVADRYTTSNAVHQASKLPGGERETYLDWLFDTEYRLLELPRPDLVLYLDMPTDVTRAMRRRRESENGTQADIHEQDEAYLLRCRESAAEIAKRCGWHVIPCAENGVPKTREEIHEAVFAAVRPLLP